MLMIRDDWLRKLKQIDDEREGRKGVDYRCHGTKSLIDEFTLSSLEVLLILATFDGLDVGLLEDIIDEDDCDDDDCDEEMSLVRMLVDGC
ncbi:hypothetical protein Tco_0893450 [Tanacetum coccineum]|uniref:Uncharacterized protein n=1 Tax=Tanacetum coccineum TaxID=301880 RepID=A0ABQ5CA58_9ASTR